MIQRLVVSLIVATASLAACHQQQPNAFIPRNAIAIDGDTFRWNHQRYRLAGIDAPELPGHCTGYRAAHDTCAPGDPFASWMMLQRLLDHGIICHNRGFDYYHRVLVDCNTGNNDSGDDVGQLMISNGYSIPYRYHGRPS